MGKKKKANNTCRTCRFVDIVLEAGALPNGHPHFTVAICRRHPPRPMVSHRTLGTYAIRGKFPPVDPDKDWCGEWKRAAGAQGALPAPAGRPPDRA